MSGVTMGQHKQPPQQVSLADALDEIVDMLNESWKDLVRLRIYRAEFELLAEQLQHYDGSRYVQQWYVADMLMGCRRLIEHSRPNVVSVREALHRLRRIADQVTAADIASCRQRRGIHRSSVADVDTDMQLLLSGQRTAGDPIGVRAVQDDLDKIDGVAKRVYRLATHSVAHRRNTPLDQPARSTTHAEIATLIDDLNSICNRWTQLLRNMTLSQPAHSSLSPAILKALELFDWDEYMDAVGAEVRRLAPTVGSFEAVEARARIEYRFD